MIFPGFDWLELLLNQNWNYPCYTGGRKVNTFLSSIRNLGFVLGSCFSDQSFKGCIDFFPEHNDKSHASLVDSEPNISFHNFFALPINLVTIVPIYLDVNLEYILAVSGHKGAHVGTEKPGQDHEAGVELDDGSLVPGHLREVSQVH